MRSHFKKRKKNLKSAVPNRGFPDPDTGKPLPLPFQPVGFMSGRKVLQPGPKWLEYCKDRVMANS